MKSIYSVISLPRTGTLSISKMANTVGLKAKHVPLWGLDHFITSEEFNFFSDTPMYDPTVVEHLCQLSEVNVKFIFIEKDFKKLFESWKKVNLLYNFEFMLNKDEKDLKPGQVFDKNTYLNTFEKKQTTEEEYVTAFINHKQTVINIVRRYNKELLLYSFDQEWEPFCSFVQCDLPDVEIPHLNVNTMFDSLN